jgi:hypothetical protein
MNRDTLPSGADVALAFGELMVRARRVIATEPAAPPATAAAAVRAAIGEIWPKVMPEAVRDAMLTAAEMAVGAGITTIPGEIDAHYPHTQFDAAVMLELTAEWIAEGSPRTGGFTPPEAFASSVAFDREEDEQTLTSLAVLLTLAHIAAADRADDQAPVCESCGKFLPEGGPAYRDTEGNPLCAPCGRDDPDDE